MQVSDDVEDRHDTKIYKRRWILLAAICLCSLLTDFTAKSFAASNEILAAYFQVSLTKLDWACGGLDAGTSLVTPVLAYFSFIKHFGFRTMAICGSACLLLSYVCILLTVHFPFLFPMMIVANLLQGVTYSVCLSVGLFFAVLWFPDHQVGLAIAFNFAAFPVGVILSSIVPPALLTNPPFPTRSENASMFQQNTTAINDEWNRATYETLMCIYLTAGIILLLLLMFFYFFASDLPPKAPTLALALKRFSGTKTQSIKTFPNFLRETKDLFQDQTYLLCISISGITFNMIIVQLVHLSQFINHIDNKISASLTSGFIITAFSVSGLVFSFISAKILQLFQQRTYQVNVGAGLLFGCSLCVLCSYYYKSLIGFYVGNIIWGAASRICNIPLFEVVTRHTYPKDETLVTVWMAGYGTTILVTLIGTSRVLTNHTTPASALIFMCVFLFVAFLASFFLKPNNNRGEADRKLANEKNEYTPLAK